MNKLLLIILTSLLILTSCKPKNDVVTKFADTHYSKAKVALSDGAYDLGMNYIEKAIAEKDTPHLEELYFLKGFMLHAYGETVDPRSYYQKVIDLNKPYSIYAKKAQQLINLTYKEEAYAKKKEELEALEKEKNKVVPDDPSTFPIVDKQPRFVECDLNSNSEIQRCSSRIVNQHISSNYNADIGKEFGVFNRIRTFVSYSVDVDGSIIDIRARGQNKILALEAKRVVSTLPDMIPGEQRGEKVSVAFTVPVTFNPI